MLREEPGMKEACYQSGHHAVKDLQLLLINLRQKLVTSVGRMLSECNEEIKESFQPTAL